MGVTAGCLGKCLPRCVAGSVVTGNSAPRQEVEFEMSLSKGTFPTEGTGDGTH